MLLGDGLHNQADRGWRGHDGSARPLNQPAVSRRLRHDVLEEEIVDLGARGHEILPLHRRSQVLGNGQGRLFSKDLLDPPLRVFVAGIDERQVIAYPEPRARLGGADVFRHFDYMSDRAAVGAARQKDHVRPKRANPLDLLMRQPPVIRRQHIHNDRPGAERASLGAFAGHALHHTCDHHLKASTRAARGNINVHTSLGIAIDPGGCQDLFILQNPAPREFLDLADGIQDAAGHVLKRRFDGGRRFAAIGLAVFVPDFLDQDGFGGRTAAIGRDNRAQRPVSHVRGGFLARAPAHGACPHTGSRRRCQRAGDPRIHGRAAGARLAQTVSTQRGHRGRTGSRGRAAAIPDDRVDVSRSRLRVRPGRAARRARSDTAARSEN